MTDDAHRTTMAAELTEAAPAAAGFETRRLREAVIGAVLGRDPAPMRVGRYAVIGPVGSGAMGDVYRAYDPKLEREVALKLLRLRPFEQEERARARLLREAQAMAKLSHPNVAAIYDAEVEGDRLFIAMEFVRGSSLQQWLEVDRPWPLVLGQFIAAGHGLAAAHDAGVLHRDFKAANVLVGEDGRIRVTDFGLARAKSDDVVAGDSAGATTVQLSGTGTIAGTPVYMAPEQHEGQTLTPATDQYAYCVALWEALAGEPPFRGTLIELADAKLRGPPPWRSSIRIPRALEAAIRRGLAVDPAQRWPSMAALVEAVARTRPKSRSRWVLGGVALAAVGALGVPQLAGEAPCTGADEALAEAWNGPRRAAVEAAIDGTHVPYAASLRARVVEAVDAYASDWKAQHEDACRATAVRAEQSEAVLDLRMTCLHRARLGLDAATRLLADVDAEAVARADDVVSGLPALARCSDVPALQADVAPPSDADAPGVESARSELATARARRYAGRYAAASEALAAADAAHAATAYEPLATELELERGHVAMTLGDTRSAEKAFDAALRSGLRFGQQALAFEAALRLVGNVGGDQDRVDAADAYASVAWGLLDRQIDGKIAEADLRLAESFVHESRGDYGAQEEALQAALALRQEANSADHLAVAHIYERLGMTAWNQSRFAEGEVHMRHALALRTEVLGPDHPSVGVGHNHLATALHGQQKYAEGEAEARIALRVAEAALGADHPNVADARNNVAVTLLGQGKSDEAEAELKKVLAIRLGLGEPQRYEVARLRINLGNIYLGQGRPAEAESEYRAALDVGEAVFGPSHPLLAIVHDGLAEAIREQGERLEEAEAHWRQGIEIARSSPTPDFMTIATAQSHFAKLLLDQERNEEALELYREATATYERIRGRDNPETSIPRWFMAKALRRLGRREEAIQQLEILRQATQSEGYGPPERAEAAWTLAQWTGRRALAEEALTQYQLAGPVHAENAAAVEAWLKKH